MPAPLTLLLIAAGLGLVPAYLHAYTIAGSSEIPNVLLGDKIVVNSAADRLKLPYSNVTLFGTAAPKRVDFVYLRLPNNPHLRLGFFKRILGLPGETIEMRDNRVIVNGQALPVESLPKTKFSWLPDPGPPEQVFESEDGHWIMFAPGKGSYRDHPRIRLPAGQYFLLGDNRDDSYDSREFGPISEDLFLGKVIAVLPTGARRK